MLALSGAALAPGQTKSAETKKGAQAAEKKALPATTEQCAGVTQDGDRCKRKAQAGSKYCWQHDKTKGAKGKAEAKGKVGTGGAKK
jgi:hypothetical protein